MKRDKETLIQKALRCHKGLEVPMIGVDAHVPSLRVLVMILPPWQKDENDYVVRTLAKDNDDGCMERDETFKTLGEAEVRYEECVKEVNGWAVVSWAMLKALGFVYG